MDKEKTEMVKRTKTKVFDTETATVIKKVTHGIWGEPTGYEATLYQTPEGDYFIYTNGGEDSPFKKENICSYTKANANRFLGATQV